MSEQKKPVQVNANDERVVPVYANRIQIAHSAEEFVMEMFAMFPPQGVLLNRVVISPEHAVRLRDALDENIKKYEENYQKICEAVVPFDPNSVKVGGAE